MRFFFAVSLLVVAASAGVMPGPQSRPPPVLVDAPAAPLGLEGRITNGKEAAPGQFPYQCGLSLKMRQGTAWCGCTIISNRWVLTAAHCTDGAEGATVYLGAHNIKDDKEENQQRVHVSKENIIVHEGWDPSILANDISVIKLSVEIEFNDYIKAATLPKLGGKANTYEGDVVWASGWGKDSDSAKGVSPVLRFVEVVVISDKKCGRFYFGAITEKMLCVSTKGGTSTCNGDSGGPLVYKDGDIDYVIGTTSFGIVFGCEVGWPGVFTSVSFYVDWIEEKTGVANK